MFLFWHFWFCLLTDSSSSGPGYSFLSGQPKDFPLPWSQGTTTLFFFDSQTHFSLHKITFSSSFPPLKFCPVEESFLFNCLFVWEASRQWQVSLFPVTNWMSTGKALYVIMCSNTYSSSLKSGQNKRMLHFNETFTAERDMVLKRLCQELYSARELTLCWSIYNQIFPNHICLF